MYTDKQKKKEIARILESIAGGASIKEACQKIPLDPSSFWDWRRKKGWEWIDDKIIEVMQESRLRKMMDRVPQLEDALMMACVGFKEVEEEFKVKIGTDGKPETDKKGNPVMVLVKRKTKTKGPNATALFFSLINMARQGLTTIEWKNVYDIVMGGEIKGDFMSYFHQMAENDLDRKRTEKKGKDGPPTKKPTARTKTTARKTVKKVLRQTAE